MNLRRTLPTAIGTLAVVLTGVCADVILLRRPSSAAADSEPLASIPARQSEKYASLPATHRSEGPVTLTAAERTALGVETVAVLPSSRPRQVRMSATTALNPDYLAHVHPRFAGEATTVQVELGQRVRQGDVIATVWSKDLGEKKSEYVDAQSQLKLNEDVLHRLERLFKTGSIPERTYWQAQRDVEGARIARDRAYRTLVSWRLSRDEINHIAQEPDSAWPREVVKAPMAGVVVEKNIVPGELVDTSMNLVVIAELSRVSVWAYAFEEDLPKLHAGQAWTVALKGLPGRTFRGRIGFVGAVVDPTQHTVTVQGTIDNPGEDLRAGMFATATVTQPADPRQPTVPTTALIDLDERTVVYVESPSQPNQFICRPVRISERHRVESVVSAGLQPGDQVVTRGALEIHQKASSAAGNSD